MIMKRLVSVLMALMMMVCCCAACAETTEIGISDQEYLDYEIGNFEAVANDGSIRMKLYVYYAWTPETEDIEHAGEAVAAMWTRGADETFQTLLCQYYTAEDLGGIHTPEEMQAFLTGMDFTADVFTVNGIPAVLFHTEFKDTLGGYYRLEDGWVEVVINNITNEDQENEAILMLCSMVDAE